MPAHEASMYANQDGQNDYQMCMEMPEYSDLDCDQASAESRWQSTHHDNIDPVPSTLPELHIAIHGWQTVGARGGLGLGNSVGMGNPHGLWVWVSCGYGYG